LIYSAHAPTFPREFGTPKRFIVYNKNDYLNAIGSYNTKRSLYISIYSFRSNLELKTSKEKYSEPIIDCVYIDLDAGTKDNPKPFLAYKDLVKLLKFLLKIGIVPRVYFSGSKGFAVYLDFEPLDLRFPKDTILEFVKRLEITVGIKSIDYSVVGDVARISRIPNTLHIKSNRFCIPLTLKEVLPKKSKYSEKFEEILDKSEKMNLITLKRNESNIIREALIEIDKSQLGKVEINKGLSFRLYKNINEQNLNKNTKAKDFRPCVRRIYESLKERDHLTHGERLALACEARFVGFTKEEVINLFRGMEDYKEDITRKQVEGIFANDYLKDKKIKCKTFWKWSKGAKTYVKDTGIRKPICYIGACSKAEEKIKKWELED
jgi:hypothetical protein